MKRSSTNRSRRPAARAMSTSKRGRDGRIASNAPSGCASMTRPSIRRPIFWPTLHFPTTGPRASGLPMRRWFALSAIGRDRPGIVADLAELIYECDCNLEDSSMTILGTEFAVLLLLSGEGADVERRLSAGCKRLEWEKRLTVFFRPLDEPPPGPAQRGTTPLECVVSGVDKAGIVARVARTLADHRINVTALSTQARPEAETGTPLFTMRIEMAVPAGVDRRVLQERLEQVASELRVELTLAERPVGC
ncbi:MAG: hypothetical protein E6J76_00180 [Deltaproteobacteria bacterium]|nr:MAG: hypothetical protein E6J76_00180 [Deltaproteobacteria bacterium]